MRRFAGLKLLPGMPLAWEETTPVRLGGEGLESSLPILPSSLLPPFPLRDLPSWGAGSPHLLHLQQEGVSQVPGLSWVQGLLVFSQEFIQDIKEGPLTLEKPLGQPQDGEKNWEAIYHLDGKLEVTASPVSRLRSLWGLGEGT